MNESVKTLCEWNPTRRNLFVDPRGLAHADSRGRKLRAVGIQLCQQVKVPSGEKLVPDLSHLRGCDWITDLDITNYPRVKNLDAIYSLPLRSLGSYTRGVDYARFPNLEKLFTTEITPNLPPSLKQLFIRRWSLPDLKTLSRLPKLEYLFVTGANLQTLNGLDGFPALERLVIYATPKLTDIAGIQNLPALRRLEVESARSFWAGDGLANHPTLESFSLDQIDSLKCLPTIPNLSSFHTSNCRDGDVRPLFDCAKLMHPNLYPYRKHYNLKERELESFFRKRRGEDEDASPDSDSGDEPAREAPPGGDFVSDFVWSWNQLRADGDTRFTPKAVAAVEKLLRGYEADLAKKPADGKYAKRRLLRAVRQLNKLAAEHSSIIETDDRETLVPWLVGLATDAGMETDEDDPTEDVREW